MDSRLLNGRYELKQKIGEGGMAVTWKAADTLLGREVAVKILRDGLSTAPQFLARFRQEAQAAASLSHEHIATVHDFGSDNGTHYIVMEYVPGEDLRCHLRRDGPLPPLEAVDIAIQVTEALDAAHAKGIVHRDIKPANILLTDDGQVKVTDFGIARALASADDTSTGTLLGSVHYVSPEQARGDPTGPQADIYSLGAVLFEMLTGRPPFQASNLVAIVHKHIYDLPPSAHSVNQDIPLEVDGLILRCLAKDLTNRYATARELLNYLHVLRSHIVAADEGSVRSTTPAPLFKTVRKQRLHRRLWLAGTVVLVLAVIGGLWAWLGVDRDHVTIPSLLNMDIDSARALTRGMDLVLREAGRVYSTNVPADRIVSQNPPANAKAERNSTVEVQLSLGSESARVPAITEMSEIQARRLLTEAGLSAGQVREQYSDTYTKGLVLASDPPANTPVPKGSLVALVVSKGPESRIKIPIVDPNAPMVPPAKSDTFTFTVPGTKDPDKRIEVVIEASDDTGKRILYRGMLSPGDAIPPQKIPTHRPVTIRVLLDDKLSEERAYEQ
jgi:eukaryotic-like serine/threonine-protein kinase